MFVVQILSVLARNVFRRGTFGPTLNFCKLLFSRTKNAENNLNVKSVSLSLHLGFNEIGIFGDTRVHAGVPNLAALISK